MAKGYSIASTQTGELPVLCVLETMKGLEIQLLDATGRTITAAIPQEVAEPKINQFKVTELNGGTLKIVYQGGGEEKIYEAPIKR